MSLASTFFEVSGKMTAGEERRRSHRRGIMARWAEAFDFVGDNCIV